MRILLSLSRRSLQNFDIGGPSQRLPPPLIKAFGVVKKAASIINVSYGMDPNIGEAIQKAADDVRNGILFFECVFDLSFTLGNFREAHGPLPLGCLPDWQRNAK
jgi:fumarate hydratase class II